jgi:hypothetical protein
MSGLIIDKMPYNNISELLSKQSGTIDLTKKYFTGFIGVKWVAMMYVSIIQVVIGITISKMINKMIPTIKKKKVDGKDIPDEYLLDSLFYSFINLSLLVFANYLMRNIVERIPFPLEGVCGYRHDKLKERYGMIISGFILMFYQDVFRERIALIFQNIL